MDVTYRRRQTDSRLERVLVLLVRGRTGSSPAARIDFTLGADVEFGPS